MKKNQQGRVQPISRETKRKGLTEAPKSSFRASYSGNLDATVLSLVGRNEKSQVVGQQEKGKDARRGLSSRR